MSVIDSKVVNIDELKLEHFSKGDAFASASSASGRCSARRTSATRTTSVPPGKRSCPFHSHRGEEEMFFIVRGRGTLRYGSETRKFAPAT
jgi:uncharacterized cupin superfamily protein